MIDFRIRNYLLPGFFGVFTALGLVSAPAQDTGSPPEGATAPDATTENSVVRQDSIDTYQVRAADSDFLAGRLQVVDPSTGELRGVRKTGLQFIQGGRIVRRAESGVSGVVQVKNLPVGVYAVIAMGPDGMAVFGIEVLPEVSGVAVPAYRFDALIVPSADMAEAQRHLYPVNPLADTAPTPLPVPPAPISTPTVAISRQAEGPITPSPAVGEDDFEETIGPVAAPIKGDPIFVQDGESSVGQLIVLSAAGQPTPMAKSRVLFIRNGRILGTVESDAQGYCGVGGLEEGTYSMVGVGPNGFVALGVQVKTISAASTAKTESAEVNTLSFVSLLQGGGASWRIAGGPPGAAPFAPGFAPNQPGAYPPPPPGAGGFGGGGFGGGFGGGAGGGGGFFGGGLLGPLLGAGVGAAIGAAVANDDGDDEGGGGGASVSPNSPPSGG